MRLKHFLSGSISYKIIMLSMLVGFPIYIFITNKKYDQKTSELRANIKALNTSEIDLKKSLETTKKELIDLKGQDQYVINKNLEEKINNIERTYNKAVDSYEKLLDLKSVSKDTSSFDKSFAESIKLLSLKDYASADRNLTDLNKQIDEEKSKIAASFVIPQSTPSSNTAPGSGFSQQVVKSDVGEFLVSLVAADLGSTRVIVDTASDNDCSNNCPVLPLATYVSRNGAYAGINGSYFCPAEYPSCSGKTNSFDLLVMNKNKHYFNASNNVYSTNPAVIFLRGSIRFVSKALDWGRDTGNDGVLSNYPLLISNDQIVYDSSSDPKFNSKGPRSFVANKGNTVFIGFVYNATMRDSSYVLKTLQMNNAMNLDEGGSTALWYGGYKAGPGRNIPNAILFIKK